MNREANLLRVRLDDETEVVFETTLFEEGREELATRGKGEVPEAPERLDALVGKIKPVAQILFGALKELNTPQEINLEFGIKLGGKTGIVFASAETECNFKIGLKWTNPTPTA
jgi:hypothetical protein